MLYSSPSFSIYTDDQNQQQIVGMDGFEENLAISDNKKAQGTDTEFSFSERVMGLIKEEEMEEEEGEEVDGSSSAKKRGVDDGEIDLRPVSPPMYLAAGLGIDISGLGGGYDPVELEFFGQRMVDEPPTHHPSILRDHVRSLFSEGKLDEAEEHCYQATLANPEDGETLMQYAQLVWELHQDQAKASSYFDRAANVAPNDSNILAARAKFLWELAYDEEDETMIPEEENKNTVDSSSTNKDRIVPVHSPLHHEATFDVPDLHAATDVGDADTQEYYKKMLEENPLNPSLLRNYAQFLCKNKVDLHGAEGYYYRAIQANPDDGDCLSEYAKLVWDLHHDYSKASTYFKRAMEASPTDSYILGAYASFLWETDEHDEEEDEASQNSSRLHSLDSLRASVENA